MTFRWDIRFIDWRFLRVELVNRTRLDTLQQKYLAHLAAAEEEEEEEVETELDYDDRAKADAYQELLDAVNEAREQGSRLDDTILNRLFRDRLLSKPCQNQGFILDGYPKTIDQAKELFSGTALNTQAQNAWIS